MKKLLLFTTLIAASASGQTAPTKSKPAPPKNVVQGNTRVSPASNASVTVLSYKALKFPPLRQVSIPDIAQFTLPNGMRVYLLENHELPLVGGFALVRTGNLFDPADKVGLAQFTGSVMRTGGTKTKTGDQLDEELENQAASVETSIGETSGSVSFNALKENTDGVLAIFKDVMLNPEFRQDKLDLALNQARGSIARRNDEAHGIAGRELSDMLYGRDTPYGWRMEYHHLDNIKREDLIAFYKRYFFPSNIMLAIQGDFNTAEMRGKLEKLFADWNYKQEPVPPFPQVTSKPAGGVYLAEKDDVTQTFVSMGHLGGMLKDKSFPALSVMSDILGGGFSSRLFTNVRTIKGLAYSVSANWGANYNHPGLFTVGGSTKAATTVDMIQAAKQEVERIQTSEVTDQELETAKQSVLNSFVFFFDHPGKILNRLVTYEYQGYPKDFIFQYQKAVEGVTKADIQHVAKEFLKPDMMTIVAVGNPKDFGKPLSTLGPVKTLDLTIPQGKPGAAPAKVDSSSVEKARKLLERAQSALGGADKLASVKDTQDTVDMEMNTPQGAMKGSQILRWLAPGHFRQTMELPIGKIETYYDGRSGWLVTPQGVMDIPPPMAKQIQSGLFRNPYTLYFSDRNPERTIVATGDNTVEISDKSGNSVRVDFDAATGLPSKTHYQSTGMTGPTPMTDTYSDFRNVSGVMVPHKIIIEHNGQKFADVTVKESRINGGQTVEQLSKKP